jgi:hypothetical protein
MAGRGRVDDPRTWLRDSAHRLDAHAMRIGGEPLTALYQNRRGVDRKTLYGASLAERFQNGL